MNDPNRLIEEAERDGWWIKSADILYTPAEFRKAMKAGTELPDPAVVDPEAELIDATRAMKSAQTRIRVILTKLTGADIASEEMPRV